MADFVFPDPSLQQTVINPLTGSTYQWKEPPGKWVVVQQEVKVKEIIWEGDNPPSPVGDYKLWYDTDGLTLYFYYTDANGNSAWVPTSTPITELEAVKRELEENGLVLMKVDRVSESNYQEIVILKELVEALDEATGDLDLDTVLKKGNVSEIGATFGGKVIVVPGEEGNEAATFGQIATLEEEIEQLKPSFDRGIWEYSSGNWPADGQYVLIESLLTQEDQAAACDAALTACMEAAGGDPTAEGQCTRDHTSCNNDIGGDIVVSTNDWSKVISIGFDEESVDGTNHSFNEVEAGMLIDVFNIKDEGFMIAEIKEITKSFGSVSFKVDILQSRGVASGEASVKFFSLSSNDHIDLSNYVRKTGDNMTGRLEINSEDSNHVGLVVSTNSADSANSAFYVENGANATVFRVRNNGKVQAGATEVHAFMATESHDVITKKFTDENFIYRSGGSMKGVLNMDGNVLTSPKDPTAGREVGSREYNDARYVKGEDALHLTGGTMSGSIDMNWQGWIKNAKDPTDGNSVGTRRYNDERYLQGKNIKITKDNEGRFWIEDL